MDSTNPPAQVDGELPGPELLANMSNLEQGIAELHDLVAPLGRGVAIDTEKVRSQLEALVSRQQSLQANLDRLAEAAGESPAVWQNSQDFGAYVARLEQLAEHRRLIQQSREWMCGLESLLRDAEVKHPVPRIQNLLGEMRDECRRELEQLAQGDRVYAWSGTSPGAWWRGMADLSAEEVVGWSDRIRPIAPVLADLLHETSRILLTPGSTGDHSLNDPPFGETPLESATSVPPRDDLRARQDSQSTAGNGNDSGPTFSKNAREYVVQIDYLVTDLIALALEGQVTAAAEHWNIFLKIQDRVMTSVVQRLRDELWERPEAMQDDQAGNERKNLVRQCLADLSSAWTISLGRLLRRQFKALDQWGRADEALSVVRRLIDLDSACKSLSKNEASKLRQTLLRSGNRALYAAELAGKTLQGEQLSEVLQTPEEIVALSRRLKGLESDCGLDWRKAAEELSQAFLRLPREIQESAAGFLLESYKTLKQRRANWRGSQATYQSDLSELTLAMLALSDALRARSRVSPEKHFHDLFEFYDCLRLQPELVEKLGRREELKRVLAEAWRLGHEVLNTTEAKGRSHFLSRLGEIGRAFIDFEVLDQSQLRPIVAAAAGYFQEALALNDPPDPRHVGNNCPRIGACLVFLRRYEEAILYFERVTAPSEIRKEQERAWEARRSIALCQQKLGERAVRDGNQQEAEQRFELAVDWFARAAQLWEQQDPRTGPCSDLRNRTLAGSLAWLYFTRGDYVAAQRQANWVLESIAPGTPNLDDTRSRALLVLGMSRMYLRDFEGAAVAIETLLDENPLPQHRLKPLIALRHAYLALGDERRASEAASRFKAVCQTLTEPDLPGLPPTSQMAFLNAREFLKYVDSCMAQLRNGATRELLRELICMSNAAARFQPGGQANAVLIGLLARAQRGVGDWEGALESLKRARQVDLGERNTSHCFFQEGQIYLDLNDLPAAARAFEDCRQVSPEHAGAWLLGARTLRLTGDFDASLQLLDELINSGRDRERHKSLTERAWTRWARYFAHGQEADVKLACDDIRRLVLESPRIGLNRFAFKLLAEMADHPQAQEILVEVLARSSIQVCDDLTRELTQAGKFDPAVREAVFDSLLRLDCDHLLKRAVGHYVMACWAAAYLHPHDQNCEEQVGEVVAELSRRISNPRDWSDLLAAKSDLMTGRIRRELERVLRLALRPALLKREEMLAHYRDRALPELKAALDTKLHALTPANYAGREPGVSLVGIALQWLNSWPVVERPDLSKLGLLVDTQLVADPDDPLKVSAFQAHLATVVLQGFLEGLARVVPTALLAGDRAIALRLERRERQVVLQLRMTFAADATVAEGRAALTDLCEAMQLSQWQLATKRFLPQAPSLEYRADRHDAILTLALHADPRREHEFRLWRAFFDYTIGGRSPGPQPNYFQEAADLFPTGVVGEPQRLRDYVLVHLDGRFVSTFRALVAPLEPRAHAAMHLVTQAVQALEGEQPDLEEAAQIIHQSSARLLESGAPIFEDFELTATLRSLLAECRTFWSGSGIDFELRAGQPGPHTVVTGSEDHIRQAILDVIFNAVKAIRQEPDVGGKARVTLLPEETGVCLLCENTGVAVLETGTGGHGIGSRNIQHVFEEMHRGSVSHGPVSGSDPYRYAWRLFLPIDLPEEEQ